MPVFEESRKIVHDLEGAGWHSGERLFLRRVISHFCMSLEDIPGLLSLEFGYHPVDDVVHVVSVVQSNDPASAEDATLFFNISKAEMSAYRASDQKLQLQFHTRVRPNKGAAPAPGAFESVVPAGTIHTSSVPKS